MPQTLAPTRPHPVEAFALRVHRDLDDLTDVPEWSMTAEQQRDALVALTRAESRLAALRLRVLAAAEGNDAAAESGATSTVAWLAHRTHQSRAKAHADLRLAQALEFEFASTRAALATGSVDQDQARAVVRAVSALPPHVSSADRRRAEEHLVELAGEHDAMALKVSGDGGFSR